MISRARSRPSRAESGRRRPSRPTRWPAVSPSGALRARSAATVRGATPHTEATHRSDRSGHESSRRRAAAARSCGARGSPCEEFRRTAATNASSSDPSNHRTGTRSRPRDRAAASRWCPSITRMPALRTSRGGIASTRSASDRTWTMSRPPSRGESPSASAAIATLAVGASPWSSVSRCGSRMSRVVIGPLPGNLGRRPARPRVAAVRSLPAAGTRPDRRRWQLAVTRRHPLATPARGTPRRLTLWYTVPDK